MERITYLSKMDQTMQPALVQSAVGEAKRPLVVCLHTWSCGLDNQYEHYWKQCCMRNWHFIYPLFRGPNWNPEACGSDLVVSDIECAVTYMKEHYPVDESKIYLAGGSGGGYAGLLMAGRRPELWSAVSVWCPISDLCAWYIQTRDKKKDPDKRDYDTHILEACGGDPTVCPQAAEQARYRSPLTWLKDAKGKVVLDIGTGIHDGHNGSVPVSHAILAYNEVAEPQDKISREDMEYIVEKEQIPEHLQFQGEDTSYGQYKVLLRKVSGRVRLTLFEGGHDILEETAFVFLESQTRGKEPVWNAEKNVDVKATKLTK